MGVANTDDSLTEDEIDIVNLCEHGAFKERIADCLMMGHRTYVPFRVENVDHRDLLFEAMRELEDAWVYMSMLRLRLEHLDGSRATIILLSTAMGTVRLLWGALHREREESKTLVRILGDKL